MPKKKLIKRNSSKGQMLRALRVLSVRCIRPVLHARAPLRNVFVAQPRWYSERIEQAKANKKSTKKTAKKPQVSLQHAAQTQRRACARVITETDL
jgi:hypothetical protein